ncbi:3'(2'),5'-bisphosphate nucleotidase CysQ [Beggiatoa alba]|nr:3'(2'),5'-bisphosphate nucleotidase CysQ [Beggiatoa alba]
MDTLQSYLEAVRTLASMAGEKILEVYQTEFTVDNKEDNTPVTQADLAANKVILAGLKALTPDIPVLSEEDSMPPFSERSQWQRYWLVDPLDGTREFIQKNGEFTVNIALIDQQQVVLGVVYAPVKQLMYYAVKGQGSYKTSAHNKAEKIHVTKHCADPVRVTGSQSFTSNDFIAFVRNLPECSVITLGSALKSCLVAEGGADIYPRFGLTSEWDTAAAQCILEEAGGYLVDMDLEPLRYNSKDSILNPHFFAFGDAQVEWLTYCEQADTV